jgi:hypothetical protein
VLQRVRINTCMYYDQLLLSHSPVLIFSEWMNGMAHGTGVETFPDGSIRHDGTWIEDEPVLN